MFKMVVFMLLFAILLYFAGWGLIKLWYFFKRERNQEFQDSVNQTIKADAASDRLDAAYSRMQSKGK